MLECLNVLLLYYFIFIILLKYNIAKCLNKFKLYKLNGFIN